MLQKRPGVKPPMPLPNGVRRVLWTLTGTNVAVATWMATVGDWLDQHWQLSAVATLGGNHLVVLWLAVLGFALLAGLAPLTAGFTAAGRAELGVLSIAGVVSIVALAGAVSLAAVVVGAVLLVAVLGRAFLR